MTNGNAADPSNVESDRNEPPPPPPPPPPAPPTPTHHGGNKVYKSGPLFLSSKGIGWTSWKKRWFILTHTSLVFYRSDPNVVPQKGSEVNLTLGGIDLNSSGSVVVKEAKKLLTVLFTDGRDGRAFTLKAETLEDLHEWKTALEEAIANAPNAASVMGQNGLFKNDQSGEADVSLEPSKDKPPVKPLVIGRPILLALEDIDGTPSFLEKALRFLEEHGVKTEGILRQAADVEDVEHRIQEYEKGRTEFSADEDAHVIADCIKYVLRELPSSPVPASCCKALLEACRTERGMRVNAMRSALCETFPEPNRRLLQRILLMMQKVAENKAVNRMSISAVAACMAPLLLRPLLAGDCELDNDFDVGGDGSVQLLQAAAAANHAQAIVITLLEEYDNMFGEGDIAHEPYTDSEESGSESGEITDEDNDSFDDEDEYDDDDDDDDEDDATEDYVSEIEEDIEHELTPTSGDTGGNQYEKQAAEAMPSRSNSSGSESPHPDNVLEASPGSSSSHDSREGTHDGFTDLYDDELKVQSIDPIETTASYKSSEISPGLGRSIRRPAVWGRTPARKNLSMESIDLPLEEEGEIQKLESIKTDLETRILKEAKVNSLLQESIEKRKHELFDRRQALKIDVARLHEQLRKEIELRKILEAGLNLSDSRLPVTSLVDEKTKANLEEIVQTEADIMNFKQKASDLQLELNQLRENNSKLGHNKANQLHRDPNNQLKLNEKIEGAGIGAPSENSSRSKNDSFLSKSDKEKDKKVEQSFSSKKSSSEDSIMDTSQNAQSVFMGETGTNKHSKAMSRKSSSSKGEERRSEMESELQHFEKGSEQSVNKRRDSKGRSLQKDSDTSRGNNSKGKPADGQPNLDRGKSESFPTGDKSHPKVAPRTLSR